MRSLLLSIVLFAACGGADAETGRYAVTWNLLRGGQPTTCAAQQLADIVITTTDMATSDTRMVSVPCTDGTATTGGIPLGQHTIEVEALGIQGEFAGDDDVEGALTTADQVITLPAFAVPVRPPVTALTPTWHLQFRGQPSGCASLSSTGVRITTVPMGQGEFTDIYNCTELAARIDLPLLPFTAKAELLGAGDAVIATAPTVTFETTRGDVAQDFILNVP